MTYPESEWRRRVLPDIDSTYPTLSLDVSEEFAWGKRGNIYNIEVTLLPLEGEDVYGVQILNENGVVVSPKSSTWSRIFRSYLEWKTDQEYMEEDLDPEAD